MSHTISTRYRHALPGSSSTHYKSVGAAISASDYRAANELLARGGHLPHLSAPQAEKIAHKAMDNGTWPHLLRAVFGACHINPNCQQRPSGTTLLAKAILHADHQATMVLLRSSDCDLYRRVRSKPTAAACLVVSPSKSLRDAVLNTAAARHLRPCDRDAVARRTWPMTIAQADVLGGARRKAKKLALPCVGAFDGQVRALNAHHGAHVADMVRNYVRTK
ncbi:MAG: hypothetical protein EOO40_10350, partial [Deltaproteobacteria bacterium]